MPTFFARFLIAVWIGCTVMTFVLFGLFFAFREPSLPVTSGTFFVMGVIAHVTARGQLHQQKQISELEQRVQALEARGSRVPQELVAQ
jgi:uncharacterized membrane protein YdjX (TVP38/TMEM64 family)